jgi:hypothetical protein
MASMNQIREGLEILSKYTDADDICSCAAEHDVFYAGPDTVIDLASEEDSEDPEDQNMSPEDRERMKELGWFIDSESGSWAHFT